MFALQGRRTQKGNVAAGGFIRADPRKIGFQCSQKKYFFMHSAPDEHVGAARPGSKDTAMWQRVAGGGRAH